MLICSLSFLCIFQGTKRIVVLLVVNWRKIGFSGEENVFLSLNSHVNLSHNFLLVYKRPIRNTEYHHENNSFARDAKIPSYAVSIFSIIYQNMECGKIWCIYTQFLKHGQCWKSPEATWYTCKFLSPIPDQLNQNFGGNGRGTVHWNWVH